MIMLDGHIPAKVVVVIFTPSFAPFRHDPTDSFQTPRLTSRSINTQWRTPLNGADLHQPVGYGHLHPGFDIYPLISR